MLSEQSSVIILFFFSHKGLLTYKMLFLTPVVTTGLSLKPIGSIFSILETRLRDRMTSCEDAMSGCLSCLGDGFFLSASSPDLPPPCHPLCLPLPNTRHHFCSCWSGSASFMDCSVMVSFVLQSARIETGLHSAHDILSLTERNSTFSLSNTTGQDHGGWGQHLIRAVFKWRRWTHLIF